MSSKRGNKFLSKKDFGDVIRNTPLISIDFMIKNRCGLYLLGLRKNAPAQGLWFNLGGRIFKNEVISAAQKRVYYDEVGRDLPDLPPQFIGVFDHIYDDNVFHDPEYGTHYVCVTYAVDVNFDQAPEPQSQHTDYRWMGVQEILASDAVHANTKISFGNLPEIQST
jgi:colanic acid biosynthesis protein WcaH